MRVRNVGGLEDEKIELQMTPMIDIVFQLLVFFIMTFKIVALEGDFNIKMPLNAPSEGTPDDRELPPFVLRMSANQDGTLSTLRLDQKTLGTGMTGPSQSAGAFNNLRGEVIQRLGDERGPGSIADTAEIELDCDYNLRYEYVIAAITAVSGHLSETDDDVVVKLIEKIKFKPARGGPR